ncbi:MAG: glycosyltransferase [Candidatus Berkelbacteria bacterium]|nr:glycosyltransferase [Candidatus Berkelbacteria bacterium]
MANSKKKKKKIIFVANTLLHHQIFNFYLMEFCIQNGLDVVVVANLAEKNNIRIPNNLKLINWQINRASTGLANEKRSISDLIKIFKREKPDLIHSFTVKGNIYGSICGKFFTHAKIVNTVTGLGQTFIDTSIKTLFIRIITKIAWYISLNLSDLVYFINHDDEKIFNKYLRHSKVIVIPSHGIDLKYYSKNNLNKAKLKKLKTLLQLKKNQILICSNGRLIKQKGFIEFWQAKQILSNKYQNLRFIIAGLSDNENPSKIKPEIIAKMQADDIIILRDRNDIKEILSLTDIFVLASYREGMPQSIIEAKAMEVPVITTDTAGCHERIVNNYNGYLVPMKDSIALAKAIEKLIKNKRQRKLFVRRGLKMVREKNDQKIIIPLIFEQYKKLIDFK